MNEASAVIIIFHGAKLSTALLSNIVKIWQNTDSMAILALMENRGKVENGIFRDIVGALRQRTSIAAGLILKLGFTVPQGHLF